MTSKQSILLALLGTVGPLWAQSTGGVLLAGSGYSIPQPDIAVAPGQIITVSLYGIPPRTLDTVRMIGSGNLLAAVNSGISAELSQTANPRQIAVPVYAVQQPKCLDPFSPCTPVTTVTVRIPFDMLAPADEFNIASLDILDQGISVGAFALRPVADNIHFGNLCDQTAIMVSATPGGNAGCVPLLQHTNGSVVTARIRHTGGRCCWDGLTVWAPQVHPAPQVWRAEFSSQLLPPRLSPSALTCNPMRLQTARSPV
jgi:hypothetical protein